MKTITGFKKRDNLTRTVFESGDFRYELEPDYGMLPDHLMFTTYSSCCCDKNDNLFLVSRNNSHPVVALDPRGNYVKDFGKGLFRELHGICMTPNDTLFCVDTDQHVIRELSKDGQWIRDIGSIDEPSDSGFDANVWLKMQRKGTIVATDIPFNPPWAFVESLKTIQRAAPPFNRPTGVCFDKKGDFFVSDGYGNASVHHFDSSGSLIKTWGGPGNEPGKFIIPHAIWVDIQDRIWVADREANSLHIFAQDGQVLGYMNEDLYQPSELWADQQYMYVGERGGGITIIDMELKVVAQLGFFNSPLRTHGICGTSNGDLIIATLRSYDGHYLMRLHRV